MGAKITLRWHSGTGLIPASIRGFGSSFQSGLMFDCVRDVVVIASLLCVVVATAYLLPSHALKSTDTGLSSAGNGAPPLANPLKIALLKWYKANEVTKFPVGNQPYGLAFDGANIWAANFNDGTVSEVRTNDGTLLGTFSSGGGEPYGVTYDGANVWVSNQTNNVTKLRGTDGKLLGTFAVPLPGWMAFDGSNIWVPSAQTQGNGSVYKLRASDGKNLGTFTVGISPITAAFDGANIWVVNGGGNATGNVTKLRASDGTVLGTFNVGMSPIGIAFDGANIWVANSYGNGNLTKLRASDGVLLGTFNVPTVGAYGVAFDVENIWVTGGTTIVELRSSDAAVIAVLNSPSATTGVAFDGANVWVSLLGSNAIGKL